MYVQEYVFELLFFPIHFAIRSSYEGVKLLLFDRRTVLVLIQHIFDCVVVIFDAKLFGVVSVRGISTGIRDADNLRCKTGCAFVSVQETGKIYVL